MRHIEINVLGQKIVGYELDGIDWYVDLHDISDWLDISYDIGEVTIISTPGYVRYLVPVGGLSRALLYDYMNNPNQNKLAILEYILEIGLSNLFDMQSVNLVDYLEYCYHLE